MGAARCCGTAHRRTTRPVPGGDGWSVAEAGAHQPGDPHGGPAAMAARRRHRRGRPRRPIPCGTRSGRGGHRRVGARPRGGARSVLVATNANVVDSPVTLEIDTERATFLVRDDLTVRHADGRVDVVPERRAASSGRGYWGVSHQLLIADFYDRLEDTQAFWLSPREAAKSQRIIELATQWAAAERYGLVRHRLPISSRLSTPDIGQESVFCYFDAMAARPDEAIPLRYRPAWRSGLSRVTGLLWGRHVLAGTINRWRQTARGGGR